MASYLEAYGAGEEQHARNIKRLKIAVVSLLTVLVLGLLLYGVFKNYGEEKQVKEFVALIDSHDYAAAYAKWGCTAAQPCRDYNFEKFQRDWGPKGEHANLSRASIGVSQSCGTGVLMRLDSPGAEPVPLWVERSTNVISFAPYPECPGRHWHVGAWLRSLVGR